MGIFGKGKGGGLMNVIRCDEEEYLVWKWRPLGQEVNSTTRENAIRYGSSLRVKNGEVAVFRYKQKDGQVEDYIEGPYDDTIKTANFPVLASIVGMAFGGESPFQAEIYYINTQGNNQLKMVLPYFEVADVRFPEMMVPVSVHGIITFQLKDYRNFIKLNRLQDFSLDRFNKQIKRVMERVIKSKLFDVLLSANIPLVQIERYLDKLSVMIEDNVRDRLHDFGVEMKYFDISKIIIDKEHENFVKLKALTADATSRAAQVNVDYNVDQLKLQSQVNLDAMRAQSEVNLQNLREMQRINAENVRETMRIQREEGQYAQHLQSQQDHLGAYTAALQADVLKTGTENLGKMGSLSLGGNGDSMNPAGLMTGMMMGGAIGQQMMGMMNSMGGQSQPGPPTASGATPPPSGAIPPEHGAIPPPLPLLSYFLAVGAQQFGPFNTDQLQHLAKQGKLTKQTYVWREGMSQWDIAANQPELMRIITLCGTIQPPAPPQNIPAPNNQE